MKSLSKSKIIAYRQCPKRLWLDIHRNDLLDNSVGAQKIMQTGHQVGEIAQRLYDPKGKGVLLNAQEYGYQYVYDRTRELLQSNQPVFEAGFTTGRALAFADIMLPVGRGTSRGWRMVEVKSSTSVKDYHLDDAAVQAAMFSCAARPVLPNGQKKQTPSPSSGRGSYQDYFHFPRNGRETGEAGNEVYLDVYGQMTYSEV